MKIAIGFTTHVSPFTRWISLIVGNPNHCFLEIPNVGVFECTRKGVARGAVWSREFQGTSKDHINTFKIEIDVPDPSNKNLQYIQYTLGRTRIHWIYVASCCFPGNFSLSKKHNSCSEYIVRILRELGETVYPDRHPRRVSPKDLLEWTMAKACGVKIPV